MERIEIHSCDFGYIRDEAEIVWESGSSAKRPEREGVCVWGERETYCLTKKLS